VTSGEAIAEKLVRDGAGSDSDATEFGRDGSDHSHDEAHFADDGRPDTDGRPDVDGSGYDDAGATTEGEGNFDDNNFGNYEGDNNG
jgi:hypothetical protein